MFHLGRSGAWTKCIATYRHGIGVKYCPKFTTGSFLPGTYVNSAMLAIRGGVEIEKHDHVSVISPVDSTTGMYTISPKEGGRATFFKASTGEQVPWRNRRTDEQKRALAREARLGIPNPDAVDFSVADGWEEVGNLEREFAELKVLYASKKEAGSETDLESLEKEAKRISAMRTLLQGSESFAGSKITHFNRDTLVETSNQTIDAFEEHAPREWSLLRASKYKSDQLKYTKERNEFLFEAVYATQVRKKSPEEAVDDALRSRKWGPHKKQYRHARVSAWRPEGRRSFGNG